MRLRVEARPDPDAQGKPIPLRDVYLEVLDGGSVCDCLLHHRDRPMSAVRRIVQWFNLKGVSPVYDPPDCFFDDFVW